ncbi:MAG TPA: phage minor head protein [Candidatus Saccharicenans sp.]|nr:phage minor head protein [Candidatus Saccharicenans sp.]
MIFEMIEQKVRRPERIILTGRNKPGALRAYLGRSEPILKRKVSALWKAMKDAVTEKDIEYIRQTGYVQQGLIDAWGVVAAEWVEAALEPAWKKAVESAGNSMLEALNRSRKAAEFNSVHSNILKWMAERGGILIRELTEGQAKTINALLRHQVFQGITSNYQLSRMVLSFIGLLSREAQAVANYRAELMAQQIAQEKIDQLAQKYAQFLLKNRAKRIARTELCSAYNFGQWESLRQMREAGLVDEVEKEWLTADDERTCPICAELDGEKVRHDEQFSSGQLHPPAHVQCRCSLGYSALRR